VSLILIRGLLGQMQKLGGLFMVERQSDALPLSSIQLHIIDEPAYFIATSASDPLDESE